MFFVYILRSLSFPDKIYIGQTDNLEQRLDTHNNGGSIYTAKFGPWRLCTHIQVETHEKAVALEKYLKSGSGRVFVHKFLC